MPKSKEAEEVIVATDKPKIPITKTPTVLKEADLRDLDSGWLLDNGTNQLLVTRFNKDEMVRQPDDRKPYAGSRATLIKGDNQVFYVLGSELESPYKKIEEEGKMDRDEFIKFVLKEKYRFLKRV